MHAQNTYFHQGSDLFEEIDPFLKQVASEVSKQSNRLFLSLFTMPFLW